MEPKVYPISELPLKNQTNDVGLVQNKYHYHLIELYLVLAIIFCKFSHLVLNNKSLTHQKRTTTSSDFYKYCLCCPQLRLWYSYHLDLFNHISKGYKAYYIIVSKYYNTWKFVNKNREVRWLQNIIETEINCYNIINREIITKIHFIILYPYYLFPVLK